MSWVQQVERRARLLHSEIAEVRLRAFEFGLDPDQATASFYDLLSELYADELPLARARDGSDLLLHIEGPAVEGTPRVSLVSGVFNNVKGQVRDLTKAIAGIMPERRVSAQEIDLALSGLARGSLFIGFAVPLPAGRDGQQSILGMDDPLYQATKSALHAINTVTHSIEDAEGIEATRRVAHEIVDPKVRDAALVAVRRIAPSRRSGVSKIGVTSNNERRLPADLTPLTRLQIGNMLEKPVSSTEVFQLEGRVREIDLDARRFELRGIEDNVVRDIRCVYADLDGIDPRQLLDAVVRVRGRVERRPDEVPRLLAVDEIGLVGPADEVLQLLE